MRVIFTELAEDDLIDIWVHIAPDSEVAADRLIDDIHDSTRRLLQFPLMGREAERLRAGARSLTHRDYLNRIPTDGLWSRGAAGGAWFP